MHGEEVMSHLLSYCLCLLCQIDCMHVRQHAQRQRSEHFAQNNFSRSILKQFERSFLHFEAIDQDQGLVGSDFSSN